jgi:hypothetical protein
MKACNILILPILCFVLFSCEQRNGTLELKKTKIDIGKKIIKIYRKNAVCFDNDSVFFMHRLNLDGKSFDYKVCGLKITNSMPYDIYLPKYQVDATVVPAQSYYFKGKEYVDISARPFDGVFVWDTLRAGTSKKIELAFDSWVYPHEPEIQHITLAKIEFIYYKKRSKTHDSILPLEDGSEVFVFEFDFQQMLKRIRK